LNQLAQNWESLVELGFAGKCEAQDLVAHGLLGIGLNAFAIGRYRGIEVLLVLVDFSQPQPRARELGVQLNGTPQRTNLGRNVISGEVVAGLVIKACRLMIRAIGQLPDIFLVGTRLGGRFCSGVEADVDVAIVGDPLTEFLVRVIVANEEFTAF